MLVRPAQRIYRTWIVDSRRWDHYRPRSDDIVIATYPKCGTTWMQRIVDLLVFQNSELRPVMQISPWFDRRFPEPVEAMSALLDAQEHRRFLKAHLPADGLPIFDEVKYVHVVRDGRDACLSFHNHALGFAPQMLAALDRAGLDDDTIGRPYPPVLTDPAEFFHRWLTQGSVPDHQNGLPLLSFFMFEASWWQERHRANVLLVHYADLKADLEGEMRRVADFLGVSPTSETWPGLVAAAEFETMRRDGEALMGVRAGSFREGARRFFDKGRMGDWHGVLRAEDLALYDAEIRAALPPDGAQWVAYGRRPAGESAPSTTG